ncbi:hypothetical protein K3495_g326 [Podosphaera aphanis]|nr:hypothetical protein K3495_g326 [Podosphaera aphanis]
MTYRRHRITRPLRILQINFGKGATPHELTLTFANDQKFDVILVQEPHIFIDRQRRITERIFTYESLFEEQKGTAVKYGEERDQSKAKLDAANQTIDNLEELTTKLNVDLSIARAGHTQATTTSSTEPKSVAYAFRSEKFPDPEKFDGSRTKLPGFMTELRMKLVVNHDRFRNEAAKVIYSISRLEARALDQVVPLVNANFFAPFPSVTAFIAHFEASFGDPDLRELLALQQGKGDFASYYSQFLRIIAYLDYNEAAKIDALTDGLSDDLKDALMYRVEKPRSLLEFATMLMTIDNRIRGRKAEQNIPQNSIGQYSSPIATHPSYIQGSLAPMDLSALQSPRTQRPEPEKCYTFTNEMRKTTAAEKQWRKENNLRLYCAAAGHAFNNFPTANRPKTNNQTMTSAYLMPSSAPTTTASADQQIQ